METGSAPLSPGIAGRCELRIEARHSRMRLTDAPSAFSKGIVSTLSEAEATEAMVYSVSALSSSDFMLDETANRATGVDIV